MLAALPVAAVVLLLTGSPATATGDRARPTITHLSDATGEIPAGDACSFPVATTSTGGVVVTWPATDPLTQPTVILTRTPTMTFTNVDEPSQTYATRPSVMVERWTPRGDGTYRVDVLGERLMQWTPQDEPPGPGLTVFTGHQVLVFEADESWTTVSAHGRSVDVCAELVG